MGLNKVIKKKQLKNDQAEYREYIPLDSVLVEKSEETKFVEVYKIPLEKIREDIARVESEIVKEKVEHYYVYTKEGVVYHVIGNEKTVNISIIGDDKLEGAIEVHNHPILLGPSIDDFAVANWTLIKESRIVDAENLYILEFSNHIKSINDFDCYMQDAIIRAEKRKKEGDKGERQDLQMQEFAKMGLVKYKKEKREKEKSPNHE